MEPVYGWGWTSAGTSIPDVPPPFRARLVRLFTWRGMRYGGVARVEEPKHELHGWWLVFSVRHVASYDFEARAGMHNVTLAPQAPVDTVEGWPQPPAHPRLLAGYAEIRAAGET